MADTPHLAPQGANSGISSSWPVRLAKLVFVGILWRFVIAPIWWMLKLLYEYSVMVLALAFTNTVTFIRTRWGWLVAGYQASDDMVGRWLESRVAAYMNRPLIRIPFTIGALIIGAPFMFASVLAIGFGIPVVIALAFDQLTYPQHKLAPQFDVHAQATGQELSSVDKTILVTDALVYQLEQELASATDMSFEDWKTFKFNGFWGWTPNDLGGYSILSAPRLFDNRVNRQLGVIYAVRIMTDAWSKETSKLGSADRESKDLVEARTQGFSLSSTEWIFPSSETYYRGGIERIRVYQDKLRQGASDARTNVTTKNLVAVLKAMDAMLQEPYGRLTDRNANVAWSKLDDEVYYAQGAVIVARDMLAAISVAYADEFKRGQLDLQLEEAIDSLSAAAHFNPWFILRGNGDSIFGDHRSKEARYISEALRRIEDLYEALQS